MSRQKSLRARGVLAPLRTSGLTDSDVAVLEAPRPEDRQDRRCRPAPTPIADPAFPAPHRPLLGYLRLRPGITEQHIEVLRRAMAAFASLEGFIVSRFFVDCTFEHTTAFAELIAALEGGATRHVVVPALHHFGHFVGVQLAMKELPESKGARVLVLFPARATGMTP